MSGPGEITILLRRAADGDAAAEERLLTELHGQLRQLAGRQLRGERRDHTLQPTALVHEAYLRLLHGSRHEWQDRVHFFATASTVMRRILVDHARRRTAGKRGGGAAHEEVQEWSVAVNHRPERIIAIDQALSALAEEAPRAARIVELRFFGGLTTEETGAALGLSERTVKREWRDAKARLYALLKADG